MRPTERTTTISPACLLLAMIVACLLAMQPAFAWHDEGHVYLTRAAVTALPAEMPAFFRDGVDTIAHVSLDPDLVRHDNFPQLRKAVGPEHYFDVEMLNSHAIPKTRYELISLCQSLDVAPQYVGFLIYAITERTQQLAVAFAEHRRYPDNLHVQSKCLVYAGWLAHYAADLEMPLHTTVHFDGRRQRNLRSPRTGIHERVDALPSKLPFDTIFSEPLPSVQPQPKLFEYVLSEFEASHALVDRVYELEPQLPALRFARIDSPEVRDFTIDRMQAGRAFLATLYLTAWHLSQSVDLQPWLDREAYDRPATPAQPADETSAKPAEVE